MILPACCMVNKLYLFSVGECLNSWLSLLVEGLCTTFEQTWIFFAQECFFSKLSYNRFQVVLAKKWTIFRHMENGRRNLPNQKINLFELSARVSLNSRQMSVCNKKTTTATMLNANLAKFFAHEIIQFKHDTYKYPQMKLRWPEDERYNPNLVKLPQNYNNMHTCNSM